MSISYRYENPPMPCPKCLHAKTMNLVIGEDNGFRCGNCGEEFSAKEISECAKNARYEVYATRPVQVLYEGPYVGAKTFFEATKDEYFQNNRTLGVRLKNSFHYEFGEFAYRMPGFIGVNTEGHRPKFFFVADFDT